MPKRTYPTPPLPPIEYWPHWAERIIVLTNGIALYSCDDPDQPDAAVFQLEGRVVVERDKED